MQQSQDQDDMIDPEPGGKHLLLDWILEAFS